MPAGWLMADKGPLLNADASSRLRRATQIPPGRDRFAGPAGLVLNHGLEVVTVESSFRGQRRPGQFVGATYSTLASRSTGFPLLARCGIFTYTVVWDRVNGRRGLNSTFAHLVVSSMHLGRCVFTTGYE